MAWPERIKLTADFATAHFFLERPSPELHIPVTPRHFSMRRARICSLKTPLS
jgi:hypothetical protein